MVALEIVSELRAVPPPTAPVNVILPVPAASVSAWAPFNVLLKVRLALLVVIKLVPVKLTGLEKTRGLAPETVILLPTWMRLALVNTRFVKGVELPTAPEKMTFPPVPARNVNDVAPLTVLEKLIFAPAGVPPALVVSIVGVVEITTGPVIVTMPPLVVMFPATLIAVEPV